MVSIVFFTVPTAKFRILFVQVILSHSRRQVVYFNATAHLTANWTADIDRNKKSINKIDFVYPLSTLSYRHYAN